MNYILMLILCVFNASAESLNRNSKILVINAKVSKSEFIKNNSRNTKNGDLIIRSDTYKFTFKKLRVEFGDDQVKLPTKLAFEMETNYEHQLKKANKVTLLVEYISSDNIELIDWTIPKEMYCFEEKNIINKDSFFKADVGFDSEVLCKFSKN